MARIRLSRPAQDDLGQVLATSAERWGRDARRRYQAVLAAAMRSVAADPGGPLTRDRSDIRSGIRSFHIRHAHRDDRSVRRPVHVLYYRVMAPEVIEIVRVLHERMDPILHVD